MEGRLGTKGNCARAVPIEAPVKIAPAVTRQIPFKTRVFIVVRPSTHRLPPWQAKASWHAPDTRPDIRLVEKSRRQRAAQTLPDRASLGITSRGLASAHLHSRR